MTRFSLRLSEPVDLTSSLEGFRRSGDDLIDRFVDDTLIRTFPTDEGFVPYVCQIPSGLVREIEVSLPADDAQRMRGSMRPLVVPAGPDWSRLLAEDEVIATYDRRYPGIRGVLQHDLFTALVRSISAQQINRRWASTIRARLAERFGVRHECAGQYVYSLDVRRIAQADPAEIRAMQFTTRKAESVVQLAQEVASGRLSLADLEGRSDEEVIERLVSLRGIGLWSGEWILCRTLGRPRVVAGDLGVRKAVGRAYVNGAMPSEADVRRLTSHWGAAATTAQALLLHALAVESSQVRP